MFEKIRQWFCFHKWEIESVFEETENVGGLLSIAELTKYKVCKKCGKKVRL